MEPEHPSSSFKGSTPLFPACTSMIQGQEGSFLTIMEPEHSSSSFKTPTSLFPAYASTNQNQEEKKDWLQNSSFTESAFKEVCTQLLDARNEASKGSISSEILPIEVPIDKRKKKSHKSKSQKRHPDPSSFSVPESESILHQLRKKTFIEETGLSYERAFLTDNTRDPENLMFDCFERTKIASYHISLKLPIGLSSKEILSWSLDFPKRKEKKSPRYFSKSSLKFIKSSTNELVCMSKELIGNTELSFIPVSVSSNNIVHPENIESDPNFMNVSSSWKSDNVAKEKGSDDKIANDSLDNEIRDKVIYYNKKLSEDPCNIEMWINFLDFQDELFLSEKYLKGSVHSKSNLTEKKIAILEKALKHNPKDVKLNTMKLKLSQDLYGSTKVMSMWDELVFYNPNNCQVWQEYLLYSISNLDTFSIPSTLKLYNKCLKTLSNISEGITESHEPSPDIVPYMLGIFNQLCSILKSCDYSEKAIAVYQALCEFNLFCEPSVEKLPANERIVFFEPFWDSGAPRVGEKEAIGWTATIEQKKIAFEQISTDSDLNNMEDEILNKKLSLSETWLEFERLRATHHWLPWKPNPDYDQTDDDVDDLDRAVAFEDVAKFLFHIPLEDHKFLLIVHFVTFLGFDVHTLGCHNMGNKLLYNPLDVDNYVNISQQLKKSHLIHESVNSLRFNIHNWTEERYDFINNLFSQVLEKFSSKYKLLCTHLWVRFKIFYFLEIKDRNKENIAHLKKFAKSILKKNENRNCLLLWFEYISVEWLTDKSNALKTFQTLLLSSIAAVSMGSMPMQDLVYFVQAFVELVMNNSEVSSNEFVSSNELLWIIFHIISKENYTPYSNQEIKPTMILKTVSVLKNYLDKELNLLSSVQNILCYCIDPYSYPVINFANCFAYFQYFSKGCDAAMQVYDSVITFVNSKFKERVGKYISEQMTVAQAKLLNYHTWNSISSIKPLQTFLCNSVKIYPYNSQLLYLLVKLRSAASVISPTRRYLAQILKNHHKSHPVTWFFALVAEFAICSSLLSQDNYKEYQISEEVVSHLGINWRIRSLYEKMLQSDICVHLPILWRSYLKFEIMTCNTEKAKSVFHRGLQNCGWSKELLMDAIRYFPDELQEILAFMTEKQIRIHTPLEEVTLLMEHAVMDT